MTTIYVFGGGKGGVGKTTSTLAVVYAKRSRAEIFSVLDGDGTNPDVARSVGTGTDSLFDPSDLDEWRRLLTMARENDVVVNLPAGGDWLFLTKASLISKSAADDGIQIFYISTLNRSRECLSLLKNTLDAIDDTPIRPVVVINEFFGSASKFDRYRQSPERKKIRDMNGIEIVMPELISFAADAMLTPGGEGLAAADSMTRHSFQEWVDVVVQRFNF